MDLGIRGRTAFASASSQGLGFACAEALAREGVLVTLNGRDPERLAKAAEDIESRVPGAAVKVLAADLTTEQGRELILGALPEIDILLNNNAGPPPGPFAHWDEPALLKAIGANMMPAVQLMRAYLPGMRARRFGRIVNITSAQVKAPSPEMGLSTGARAALTAISKSISIEVAADNVTINNLLPGRVDSPRLDSLIERIMARDNIQRDEARSRLTATIAAKRLGRPEEVGAACAFLCSAHAGYISGQNLQVDGGSYPGLV